MLCGGEALPRDPRIAAGGVGELWTCMVRPRPRSGPRAPGSPRPRADHRRRPDRQHRSSTSRSSRSAGPERRAGPAAHRRRRRRPGATSGRPHGRNSSRIRSARAGCTGTGDLGDGPPEGGLQVLGRIDHQVKLRGSAFELGEIESVLTKKAGLDAVAVILREDARPRAWWRIYVSKGRKSALRRHFGASRRRDARIHDTVGLVRLARVPASKLRAAARLTSAVNVGASEGVRT